MPFLHHILLTSTHADSRGSTSPGTAVTRMNIPDNSETIAAQTITQIDLHQDLTLPSNVVCIFTPYEHLDMAGSSGSVSSSHTQLFHGTTSMSIGAINYSTATSNDPGTGLGIGLMVLLETADLKHVASGF